PSRAKHAHGKRPNPPPTTTALDWSGAADSEDFPGPRRRDGFAPHRPRIRCRPGDKRCAAFRQHALRHVDVVLEPDARVTAKPDRRFGHRLLVPPDRSHAPRRTLRNLRGHEANHLFARADTTRHP